LNAASKAEFLTGAAQMRCIVRAPTLAAEPIAARQHCVIAHSQGSKGVDPIMPTKHPNTRREGGPGASHENRRQPNKSKPYGELNTKTKAGDPRPREQVKGRHKAR
jgi:hypothetical protein